MPISQKFFEEYNKKDTLEEFELKENLKTVLLFAGGKMGLARKNIFEILEILAKKDKEIQIIAISGKNPKVYEKFIEISNKNSNIKVLEFTTEVAKLMSISDLVITKPRWYNINRSYSFRDSNTCYKSNTRARRRKC